MTERFTLLTELGRGGMGVVWKARDEETGKVVALKLLHPMLAQDSGYLERFERELELAKRIHSAHVVEVLGYGMRDGAPYLALEFVDGPTLRERLSRHGPYTWPDANAMLVQLTQGLADAHAAGVVHRDIKPANVLIDSGEIAKIADFGIAKGIDLSGITATSTVLGTPAYLAPEGPIDARSDLYSVGIVGYELLCGVAPFAGTTYQEVIVRHIREAPDLTKIPPESRDVIAWLLAKDPAQRPQRASALLPVLYGAAPTPKGSTPPAPARSGGGQATPTPTPPTARPFGPAAQYQPPPPNQTPVVASFRNWTLQVSAPPPVPPGWGQPGWGQQVPQQPAPGARWSGGAPLPTGPTRWSGGAPLPNQQNQAPRWAPIGSTPPPQWPAVAANAFTSQVGPMAMIRDEHVAAILPDGRGLIAGGASGGFIAAAEMFDPRNGAFRATGSMTVPRVFHTASVLFDGRVLVAGGYGGTASLDSAEMFDLRAGGFTGLGRMGACRAGHSATVLADGRVLIAGGRNDSATISSAEVFDSKSGTFSRTHTMKEPRAYHSATLLPDGRVLIAGGCSGPPALSTAEIYDPVSGRFTETGSMVAARDYHTAALLPDGRVLIAGGEAGYGQDALGSAELFDPRTGSFSLARPMSTGRVRHTATLVSDGRVVVAGGIGGSVGRASVEVYDPRSGAFSVVGSMASARGKHTATLLFDKRILIAGGLGSHWSNPSAEVIRP